MFKSLVHTGVVLSGLPSLVAVANKTNRTLVKALCLSSLLLAGLGLSARSGQAQTVTSLSISPSQPSVSIGATTQLSVTANYSNGSSSNISSGVSWNSADPRLVSVSGSGVASGNATGTVAITASYGGQSATTSISSSMGNIQWSGPITITQGGTYSGNWKSTNSSTPAVLISTTQPVVIQNSYVTGNNDLISAPVSGNNVTIRNVIGVGVNPNVTGQTNGIFADVQNTTQLTVENCYFENVRFGVWVRGYVGNYNGTQTVTILNNRGRNILGLESNGNGGYLNGDSNWQWAHAIQLSGMPNVPGIVIAWNEIINYPNQSLVNENVNMYDAGGTSSSPALFHDNYIQGGYGYVPATGSYNGGGWATDGSGGDTVQNSSSFNKVYDNQVVGTVNMGIEFSTGHDNYAYNNRVISSGLLPNGAQISAQNVGIDIYDVYGNTGNGSMYNNNFYSNTVGWMCWASRCAWNGYRNDQYYEVNTGDYGLNTSIASNPITLQMEANEYATWQGKTSSNGVVVGPTESSQDSNSGSGGSGGSGGGSGSTTISSSAWYTVTDTNSNLCVDAANGGTANGTAVVQYTCGSAQYNQEWQFQPTDSGYYKVVNRNASGLVWDVTGGPWATADSVPLQIWSWAGGTNQEWMPVPVANGAFKFVARNSSKCLDVPGASLSPNVRLQQYDCNETGAQSYTLQSK